MGIQDEIVAQLDDLLKESETLSRRSKHDDFSDLPEQEVSRSASRVEAAIHRVAGRPSNHVDQTDRVLKAGGYAGFITRALVGILASLRDDVAAGYLKSQRELIHAELFADFLEMAQYLLNEGYKDAAAVIAGSSLETHLRQLCQKNRISSDIASGGRVMPARRASRCFDIPAWIRAARSSFATRVSAASKADSWRLSPVEGRRR